MIASRRSQVALKLFSTPVCTVFREYSFASAGADSSYFPIVHALEQFRHLLGILGQEHFIANLQDGIQTWPVIGQYRASASCRFEQAYGGGVSLAHHFLSSQV